MSKAILRKLALTVVVVLTVVGCFGTLPAQVYAAQEKPTSFSIASGGSGGTYYYIAAGQAQILTEKLGLNVTAESTGGSFVENFTLASQNPALMGLGTVDGLYAAVTGKAEFGFTRGPLNNVAMIQAGYDLTLYGVTMANSGIKSIGDLKGKRISTPLVGTTAYFQLVALLEQFGFTLQDMAQANPTQYAEAADALRDGMLDCIFVAGGVPSAAVTDLDTTRDILILDIDSKTAESVVAAYPFWSVKPIPAGVFNCAPQGVNVMKAVVCLVVSTDLDDEIVYQITKCLNESSEDLGIIHQEGAKFNVNTTKEIIDMNIVPLHPGAKRYYDEVFASK